MLEKAGFGVEQIRAQGRVLRLGYLVSRVAALFPSLGHPMERLVTRLGLRSAPISVNLGDLFTAYARKKR
jgi:hypothetical protein